MKKNAKLLSSPAVVMAILVLGMVVIYNSTAWKLRSIAAKTIKMVADSKAAQVDVFLELVKSRIMDISTDGYVIICVNLLNSAEKVDKNEVSSDLTTHLEKNKIPILDNFSEVFVMNIKGVVVASNVKEHKGADLSKEPEFLEGKKGFFFGKVELSEDKKNSYLSVSAPIVRENEVIGVVTGVVNPAKLYQILFSTNGTVKSGEVYLVNSDKFMISPSRFDDKAILEKKIDTKATEECMSEDVTGEDVSAAGTKCCIYKNYRGIDVMGAFAAVPSTGWYLIAEVPSDEALLPLKEIYWLNMVVGGILILVIFTAQKAGMEKKSVLSGKGLRSGSSALPGDEDAEDSYGHPVKEIADLEKNIKTLKKEKEETEKKVVELEKINKFMIGREGKMVELKKEIERLKAQIAKIKPKDNA